MEEKILNKIDEISNQMIDGIKSIVQINSVQSEATENAPFGLGIQQALEATLELASSLGFETENVDNRVGIVKYGCGDDYIGIMGHLDVVPVGDGWNHDPFSAYEDETGRIFARGILDNKGPILANLYALYAIKELGIKTKHPIWILFGTNEETGFEDLKYYLKKKKPPIMGWTPDCKYPVVYAERGRGVYQISCGYDKQAVFNEWINEYILTSDEYANKLGLDIKDKEFGMMQLRNRKLVNVDNKLAFSFTLSYPACISNEEIMQQVASKLVDGLELNCVVNFDPVRFDKDCFLCKTLKDTYEKVTGMDGTPVTTTGGTYAKLMPNIVPFGPSFPGQKGIGHNPNEWMDRKDIITNAKIYALSMVRVANGE
ncbi:MAG: Sapep family Mn(2+)-dependent dipeptidase [Erysipelotrichaceae bacterium]|uniref:Sapep family Mn(2+)-dependent dipeptidase n=1 Tax=Floccifex sp. TaxID=2815810 RepID=UPI002A751D9D|nr:Sapep family Mn(2+)-dependent dipeptidase [Floccifex sp.]MDD7282088.1 Sapep family Mn(2+)-dependent dipeptidase [Erysipelotrichaceae bacterium]MDY2958778.1 Sapep family Mn(2+)-dependent dipeptidase [Floccifex sp.]